MPKAPVNDLTQEQVRALFDYDPNTGLMRRLVAAGTRGKVGDTVGYPIPTGHMLVGVRRRLYYVHRLVWLWVHGVWPTNQIDHIDGDPTNNRLANLRECTHAENMQNRKPSGNSLLGTTYVPAHWVAQIGHNGKIHRLGTFPTEQEAHEAYLEAKARLHTFNPVPREQADA